MSRRRLRQILSLGVAVSVAGALAAGCGSSGGGGKSVVNPGEQGGTPVNGGTVNWAEGPNYPPNYVFPFVDGGHFSTWNINFFQYLMYRPLYWAGVGQDPTKMDQQLSVGEQPVWSNDDKTVSVTLKPWKWSNGESVDAQDVVFFVNMYKAEKQQNGGYIPPLTSQGLDFFPDNVKSVTANGQTVTFNLDRAYSQTWFLFNELSQIVPMPEAWDITGPGQKSDCSTATGQQMMTDCAAVWKYLYDGPNRDLKGYASSDIWSVVDGPWKMSSYSTDGAVSFVPNPDYSGPYKPRISRLNEVPFTSSDAEYNVIRSGPNSGQNSVQSGYLPFAYIKDGTKDPSVAGPNPLSSEYDMDPWIGYSINYFPVNLNNPTVGPMLKQAYIRQALESSVDQPVLIDRLFKGYGYLTTGPQPLLPKNNLVSDVEKNNPWPFDTNKAKQLLTSHGWNTGSSPATCEKPGTAADECGAGINAGAKLSFQLKYASGVPTMAAMMNQLATDAGQAGIQLVLSQGAGPTISQDDTACTPDQSSCSWQMGAWGGGWVYAPDYLPTGETLFATGAVANYGSYSDPRADALIARSIEDSSLSAYQAAEDYLAQQVPVIWLPNQTYELTMWAKKLRGYDPQNVFLSFQPERWYYVK
jgi:peptide/nickel transport system substrate-binding protein